MDLYKFSKLSKLSKTAQIMLTADVAVCFVLMILGLLVINLIYRFEGSLPYAAGIMIGCIHSLIKIVLLEKSINRTLDISANGEHEAKKASGIAYLHYVGRFVLTGAVFALVIIFPSIFGLFGAIIGVLSLQAAAIAANIILQKKEAKNNK